MFTNKEVPGQSHQWHPSGVPAVQQPRHGPVHQDTFGAVPETLAQQPEKAFHKHL